MEISWLTLSFRTNVTEYETLSKTFAQVVGDFGSIDGL